MITSKNILFFFGSTTSKNIHDYNFVVLLQIEKVIIINMNKKKESNNNRAIDLLVSTVKIVKYDLP